MMATRRPVSVPVIGIDLGTCNSCFGYMKNGHFTVLQDEMGNPTMPSVVIFADDGNVVSGSATQGIAHTYNKEIVYEIKRIIGQSTNSEQVRNDLRRYTFDVVDEFGDPMVAIRNDKWNVKKYPEEISGFVLEKIIKLARSQLDEAITEAVITVPAYFGNDQRAATINAATCAKISTIHIINEPTAAALAFQYENKKKFPRNLLIYDFGGGTFDVSIVKATGNHCTVLAIDGDCHLGGTDIDENLINLIKRNIENIHGRTITREDHNRYRRLKRLSEVAKKNLSSMQKFVIDLEQIFRNVNYQLEVTREMFENINQEIFDRTLKIVKNCLSMSGLAKTQISNVVLVGGSSRIPKVREMLAEYFGQDKINVTSNPDQTVAYGAALFAASLHGDKTEGITFDDVLSLSLGTDVVGNKMSTIIRRNTPVPCTGSKSYKTVCDNQSEMTVKIYQGERLIASENSKLGELVVSDLTQAPKGEVLVSIRLTVDNQGILSLSAKENNTDKERTLRIDMKNHRLAKNNVEEILREAEKQRRSDEDRIRFANKKMEFEQFCNELSAEVEELEDDERRNLVFQEIDVAQREVNGLGQNEVGKIDQLRQKLSEIVLRN